MAPAPVKRLTKKSDEYIEKSFALIQEKPCVEHVIIMSKSGLPIKSSMDQDTTLQYIGLFGQVATKSGAVIADMDNKTDLEPDVLKHVRIKTKYDEIFITIDDDITFLVMQQI